MIKCEHTIGILYCYEDTDTVTLEKLKSYVEDNLKYLEILKKRGCASSNGCYDHYRYTLKDYFDSRKNNGFFKFTYCPDCGEKLDFNKMLEE